jgi:O-antigen/teichoic acid export membrane protein
MTQQLETPASQTVAAPTPASGPTLWSASARMLAGNVAYAVCQGGWLILISKLASDDSRGRFVLAMTIAAPIIAFASLGLRSMLATDVKHEHSFSSYVALRLGCCFVAFAVILAIAFAQPRETGMVVVAIGVAKCIELASELLWGRMQQLERFDRIAISFALKGAASLLFLTVGLIISRDHDISDLSVDHGAFAAACGIGIGFLLSLLFWDIPNARTLNAQAADAQRQAWSIAEMRGFIATAAPLAFATSLVLINGGFPIYFMRWHYGPELAEPMIGVFGAFNYLVQIGAMVVAAVAVAASPRLARYYGDGKRTDFYRLLFTLVGLCALLGIAGVIVSLVAGETIVSLLFKREDAQHGTLLVWLMASAGISYVASILGYAVTATRRFSRFTLPYLGVTIVGMIACAILIPRFGLTGAAWSSAIINLACCAAPLFILTKLHFEEL